MCKAKEREKKKKIKIKIDVKRPANTDQAHRPAMPGHIPREKRAK